MPSGSTVKPLVATTFSGFGSRAAAVAASKACWRSLVSSQVAEASWAAYDAVVGDGRAGGADRDGVEEHDADQGERDGELGQPADHDAAAVVAGRWRDGTVQGGTHALVSDVEPAPLSGSLQARDPGRTRASSAVSSATCNARATPRKIASSTSPPAASDATEPPTPSPTARPTAQATAQPSDPGRDRRGDQPHVVADHQVPVQPAGPSAQHRGRQRQPAQVGQRVGQRDADHPPAQRQHGVGGEGEDHVGGRDGDLQEERRPGVLEGVEAAQRDVLRRERRQPEGERRGDQADVPRALVGRARVQHPGQVRAERDEGGCRQHDADAGEPPGLGQRGPDRRQVTVRGLTAQPAAAVRSRPTP